MTRRLLSLAPGAGLLLHLAGCAETTPSSERAQFLEPPAMERTLAQSGTGKSAKVDAIWPESDWWRRFHSPNSIA